MTAPLSDPSAIFTATKLTSSTTFARSSGDVPDVPADVHGWYWTTWSATTTRTWDLTAVKGLQERLAILKDANLVDVQSPAGRSLSAAELRDVALLDAASLELP